MQSRILLVDDHPDTLSAFCKLLKNYGHTVVTAQSCREALQCAEHERFDLLVSDARLPDGNGLDLLPQIRARYYPIAGISISGMADQQDRSAAAGFARHLLKPTQALRLPEVIEDMGDALGSEPSISGAARSDMTSPPEYNPPP